MDEAVQVVGPSRKNWVLLALAGVTILLVGVGIGLVAGKYIYTPKPVPAPTVSVSPIPTPDSTSNWKTYKNTKYHYSIEFPPDLKTQTLADGVINQEAGENTDHYFIYNISSQNPYVDRFIEIQSTTQIPVYDSTWTKYDTEIGGLNAINYVNSDPKLSQINYLQIPNSNQLLEITETSDPQKTYISNQILSTFKFVDQTSADTVNWKTYTNPKHNFEFKYPSLWDGPMRISGTEIQGQASFQGTEGIINVTWEEGAPEGAQNIGITFSINTPIAQNRQVLNQILSTFKFIN